MTDLDPENTLDTTDPETSGHLGWQLILPVGFIVLGVMIFVASFHFPDTAAAVTEPGLYPGIVSAVLVVACLLSIWETLSVRRRRGAPVASGMSEVDVDQRHVSRQTWFRAVTVTVLSGLYVVVIPYIGFVVTTFLYCFAIAALLRGRSLTGLLGAGLIAAGLVAAAYFGFVVGLNAPLPRGELF